MPDRRVRFRRAVFALVLASYICTAFFSAHYSYASLMWDDSEYVAHALDTADHVAAVGVPSWLAYIPGSQHYGKPPLYVNSLALFILFFGRSRVPLAVGALAAVTAALLGIAVFSLVRRATSFWFGILAMLAIAGMPVVARWAPAAYPDMQLSLCVLWVIGILAAGGGALMLGIALGAGVLAKTTFPFFVILPIAYWAWWGGKERSVRIWMLLKAGMLAAVIAALWYPFNLAEALQYAQDSYADTYQANPVFLETLAGWLRIASLDGLGFTMLALALVTAAVFLVTRRRERPPFPREHVTMLLLGALPVLLIALPSPWKANRHILSSLVLFGLALLLTMFWMVRASRAGRAVVLLLAAGFLAQWSLVKAVEIPATAILLQNSITGLKLHWLLPALVDLQPTSTDAVAEVINRAEALGPAAPSRWYLSGNDGFINIPRLQLAAKVRQLPITFDWAEYFKWPEAKIEERMKAIASGSAILLIAKPVVIDAPGESLNRNMRIVRQHLADFQSLGEGSYVSLYASRPAYDAMTARIRPFFADYSGRVQILGLNIDARALSLRMKLLAPLPCRYKLLVHAFPADQQMRIWDQPINPQLCKWQPGDVRVLTFQLPEAYTHEPYRLQLGFFDEADSEHGWPPLKVTGGGTSICVPPPSADARVMCAVGNSAP